MRQLILSIFLVLSLLNLNAQDSVPSARLILDFPLVDYPFLKYAAEMAANKRLQVPAGSGVNTQAKDYLRSYENLSMPQALALTKDLHSVNYYFNNRLWDKWIKPVNLKKKLLNRVAAHASAGVIDYAMAYQLMILGPVWLHEEYHRSGLTLHGISSHNDTYYRFGNSQDAGGSISAVRDEDMARFKKRAPQEMVRSFSAGIESQYELVREMRKDNFFKNTRYPNAVMNILITKEAVDYVNAFKRKDYDASIDSMNKYGEAIADRDFVGWDFTGWVYDLFRPYEDYEARGVHPSGLGVDRAIKASRLNPEEYSYLKKLARLQYLNFLSPAMIGIDRIPLKNGNSFSFAARHTLNSFGYDLGLDLFGNWKGSQWFIGLHGYRNHDIFLPGIEIEKRSLNSKILGKEIALNARAMLWLQPKNQEFRTRSAQAGGLLQVRLSIPVGKTFSFYTELEGKTEGWVAGNPYLENNAGGRFGISMDLVR
ncbi:MAG: hypothetical protein ACXWB9_09995 [Flavisolibacter sp.]